MIRGDTLNQASECGEKSGQLRVFLRGRGVSCPPSLTGFGAAILLGLVICPAFLGAQMDTAWVRRYDGACHGWDTPNAIVVDHSGATYVCGYTAWTWPYPDRDSLLLIKYDALGNVQWRFAYSRAGQSWDKATALALDSSGNVIVAGGAYDSTTDFDVVIIKFDSLGNERWLRLYDGVAHGDDMACAVAVDRFGDIYATGGTVAADRTEDALTLKYSSSGILQWANTYSGSGDYDAEGWYLVLDTASNVYVTGYTDNQQGGGDGVTIKYSTYGERRWAKRFHAPGSTDNTPAGIAVDRSHNVFAALTSDNPDGDYITTIKYDSTGREQWSVRYDSLDEALAEAVAMDSSGLLYVTGYAARDAGHSEFVCLTVCYDSSGARKWVARNSDPRFRSLDGDAVCFDNQGRVCVCGSAWDSANGAYLLTLVCDREGNQIWSGTWPQEPLYDVQPVGIASDRFGNLSVTGGYASNADSWDWVTIKYRPTNGVTEPPAAVRPTPCARLDVYPNPFTSATTIRYTLPAPAVCFLRMYDPAGKLVATLAEGRRPAGTSSFSLHPSSLPAAVYLLHLETRDSESRTQSAVAKLIVR